MTAFGYSPLNPVSLIFLVHRLLKISVKRATIVTHFNIYHNNIIIIITVFFHFIIGIGAYETAGFSRGTTYP